MSCLRRQDRTKPGGRGFLSSKILWRCISELLNDRRRHDGMHAQVVAGLLRKSVPPRQSHQDVTKG